MIGWNISIYRLAQGGAAPAAWDTERGDRVAVWQTGLHGLDWLEALVTSGDATNLGGDGYPDRYTVRLSSLMGSIQQGPPHARDTWIVEAGDIIDWSKWPGKTTVYEDVLAKCEPDEWLMVVAWDES